jgi:hypothetical protein
MRQEHDEVLHGRTDCREQSPATSQSTRRLALPEAASILPRLRECHTEEEACQVIHQEFVRAFEANLAGPAERYAGMAREIWRLWQGRQETSTRTEVQPR